ncbi:MAG: acyl carrier protein [Actinobacteria bacterium]|nr:acyl carrier protein [Actinomycetota bacterium]MBW3646670.1 acyl carrier protein [Actinomycetota bacterium]
MGRNEVLAVVRDKAVELLDVAPEAVAETTSFADDLGLDSLSLVEWTLVLEDTFDVELPEEEVTAVATIGGLVDLVLRQKQL